MLTAVVLALLGVVSPPLRISKPVGKPPAIQTPPPYVREPALAAKTALSESSSPSPEGEEAAVLVLERWKMSAKAGAQAGSVA